MREAISLGRLKKNLSSFPAFTSSCQAPRNAMPSSVCQTIMGMRGLAVSCIAGQHLRSQLGPDLRYSSPKRGSVRMSIRSRGRGRSTA